MTKGLCGILAVVPVLVGRMVNRVLIMRGRHVAAPTASPGALRYAGQAGTGCVHVGPGSAGTPRREGDARSRTTKPLARWALCALALAACFHARGSAASEVVICNKGNTPAYVAEVEVIDLLVVNYHAYGWYTIKEGSCMTIYAAGYGAVSPLYVGVQYQDEADTWRVHVSQPAGGDNGVTYSDKRFCVPANDRFDYYGKTLQDMQTCKPGFQPMQFSLYFDLGSGGADTMTYDITPDYNLEYASADPEVDTSTASAPAAPAPAEPAAAPAAPSHFLSEIVTRGMHGIGGKAMPVLYKPDQIMHPDTSTIVYTEATARQFRGAAYPVRQMIVTSLDNTITGVDVAFCHDPLGTIAMDCNTMLTYVFLRQDLLAAFPASHVRLDSAGGIGQAPAGEMAATEVQDDKGNTIQLFIDPDRHTVWVQYFKPGTYH